MQVDAGHFSNQTLRWFDFQDNCPMCHEKLYRSDATSQTEDLPENQNVNNNQNFDVPNADNNLNQDNEIEE